MVKRIIIYVLLWSVTLLASSGQEGAPRDTSYTMASALQKVRKQYPYAQPAGRDLAIQEVPDQCYGVRNDRKLHYDWYLPTGNISMPLPLIIMVHGGGWRSGDKCMLAPLASQLAKHSYLVASIEYRLSTEAIYPAAVEDIQEALSYFRQQSGRLHVDTNRIVLLGCSAGATLASLVAVKAQPGTVKALVNVDGVVDLTDPSESGKDTNPEKPSAAALFFGCTYQQCAEKWREASAVNHVDEGAPVTLFVNSSIPRFHAGRDAFIQALAQYEIYSEVQTLKDSPHSFWLFEPWMDSTVQYIFNFLDKTL
jgi:pectinesterase